MQRQNIEIEEKNDGGKARRRGCSLGIPKIRIRELAFGVW